MASDVRIWTGSAWLSIKGPQGPAGPSSVSANAGQLAKLGTDNLILVAKADLDALYVNVVGDTMTGALTVPAITVNGNITSTGTAHSFAANSIQASAVSGLPTASAVAGAALAATGVAGVSTAYARADHTHPLPTLVALGAAAATHTHKLDDLTDVTVTTPATGQVVRYNGTTFVNAKITYADIDGAPLAGITQAQADARYVELTGDWMSGPLRLGGTATFTATAPLDIDANTFRVRQTKTPTGQTDVGEQGTVCWDDAYLYACVATNQWRRIPWIDWSGAVTGGSWAPLTTAAPPVFQVAYGGGLFTADAGKWSTDGASWYQGTGLPTGNGYTRHAFGSGTLVKAPTTWASGTPNFYTSADGKAWTARAVLVGGTSGRIGFRGLCFGGGRFVALLNNSGSTTGNVLPHYSANALTWTASAAPVGLVANTLSDIAGVAYGAGLFVAVGTIGVNPTARYLTSPDGINWTARSLPLSAAWNDVSFANGRFVAIAPGLQALTSVDGINWTQVTMPASADWETLIYGGGKWIAVAPNTSTAATSSDGITWSTIPLPSAAAWNSIATNGTVFVATNGSTTPALFSATPQQVTYFPITASRTLVASDANATVANVTTGATPVTITIPTNATVPFPIGTSITIMDASQTAVTTIAASAGVTLNWSGKLVGSTATVLGGVGTQVQIPGPLSQVVLRKVAVDSWTILY